ncbi:GNAT family N-acetyltransferase [Brevibacillus ginsengisoli]|uniref:GNAT family N-acetyltransferase n=1 Tax=Brevibacillus ginsengisoli TaxID=363854 RepID=UPI003CFB751D
MLKPNSCYFTDDSSLCVRSLNEKDIPWLVKWLSDPRVLQYYEGRDRVYNEEKVRKKFYPNHPEEVPNINRCLVEYEGSPIGYLQFYPLSVEMLQRYQLPTSEAAYGMDQFIGEPDYWNQGIGKMVMDSMIGYLSEELKVKRIIVDPRVSNLRAIRCYEKCGFCKRGVLQQHEWHEGVWHDCWLMEYV